MPISMAFNSCCLSLPYSVPPNFAFPSCCHFQFPSFTASQPISALVQCPQSGWPRGGWQENTLVLGTQDQRLHSSREKGPSCLLPYCSHLRNLPGRNLWWNPPEEKKNYNIVPGQERHPSRNKGETRNTWKKERQKSRRNVAARPATRAVQEPQGRIK